MFMPDSAEKSFKFKKIAIIAFCLMIFDALIFGIPSLGLIVLFLIVCASGISAFIYLWRDKKYAKLYAIKAAIYLIALMGIGVSELIVPIILATSASTIVAVISAKTFARMRQQ